ncbi:MAG: type II toxin-antitoxin system HicB family antitoxin [bacterium]
MNNKFILNKYIDSAMMSATCDKLEDNTFAGKSESCKGVIAFADNLKECEIELQSVLEDWILVGLWVGFMKKLFT